MLGAILVLAAGASPGSASAKGDARATPPQRQVFLLGLRQRGRPSLLARQVSSPASPRYRRFLSPRRYRSRFSPRRRARRRVVRFLAGRRGVGKVELSSNRTLVLAALTPRAGRRIFCAASARLPVRRLCIPPALRGTVRQVSAGEVYELGSSRRARAARGPRGCAAAIKTGAFTPNQLSTAYGVDALRARGLQGSGVRVATLSSQEVDATGFRTWARCFGLRTPRVRQFAMPGANTDTATAPEETVLDVEALASLAPRLERISPIFVPLDQGFSNSFLLFMFGALDPGRQGGNLPHILSISDGVCEYRFTADELQLGRRLLIEAAVLGITTLAASGDLGLLGCFTSRRGALFPSSFPYTTSVGGTDLSLTGDDQIARQAVWSTFASQPAQGAGSGGGPSSAWDRPSFQRAPGLSPLLQPAGRTRLAPDLAAMASFTPGLAVFQKGGGGWGLGGGTSAATPLMAAIVALVMEQERKAGRPPLGSLQPLLYELARGPGYNRIFFDVTEGTSSRDPSSAAGKSPAGGAAQPGYDLATGLGSLNAAAFADAVASPQAPTR